MKDALIVAGFLLAIGLICVGIAFAYLIEGDEEEL